ncbi:unnamed protein product [Heligmosomoides polygyrus]|uniref:Uncharacterized protein n=1 Tax=Heligmosomoides polygyrus TaxID=6339 RepID=A0A3P8I5N7_HELPZ|nr:unnamed protein product [Heligmosomoides polygyrus]
MKCKNATTQKNRTTNFPRMKQRHYPLHDDSLGESMFAVTLAIFALSNVLMWWAYTKSLSLSDSSVQCLAINTGTNFALTVGFTQVSISEHFLILKSRKSAIFQYQRKTWRQALFQDLSIFTRLLAKLWCVM